MRLVIKNLGMLVSSIWELQLFNESEDDDDDKGDVGNEAWHFTQ